MTQQPIERFSESNTFRHLMLLYRWAEYKKYSEMAQQGEFPSYEKYIEEVTMLGAVHYSNAFAFTPPFRSYRVLEFLYGFVRDCPKTFIVLLKEEWAALRQTAAEEGIEVTASMLEFL